MTVVAPSAARRSDSASRASPARTWDVLTNFAEYPVWAHDLKDAVVVERDDEGRGVLVAFRAAALPGASFHPEDQR